MKLARRSFLKLLPAAGFAGKAAADEAALRLAGMGSVGVSTQVGCGWAAEALGTRAPLGAPIAQSNAIGSTMSPDVRRRVLRQALRVSSLRNELESILYEDYRQVGYLDPDLVSKRSFSLAAKVTFQRQRNVARALQDSVLRDSTHDRAGRWAERVLSWVWG